MAHFLSRSNMGLNKNNRVAVAMNNNKEFEAMTLERKKQSCDN